MPHLLARVLGPALLLVLGLGACPALAQSATPPDSLDKRLAAAPDSARLRLLLADAAALRNSDPERAEQRARAAVQLARQQQLPRREIVARTLLAKIFNSQGRSKEAVQQLDVALRMAGEQHDTLGLANAYLYLGSAYKNLKQYGPALEYAQQAEKLYERQVIAGNKDAAHGAAVARNNSGTARMESKQYAAAIIDFTDALRRGRRMGDSSIAVLALYNLGTIALITKQGAPALHYYRQTLAIDQATDNPQGQAESWLNMGDALALLHRPAEAEKAYLEAYKIGKELQIGPLLRVVYDGFATLYEDTGRLPEALRWRKRFQTLNDSLYEAETAEQVTEMRTKYETEKQQAQNRLQAAQLRTQQQMIRRRNTQLLAGLAVFGLLAAVSWLLYNRRRLQQQVGFEQERQRLERQRSVAVLEAEENERRRIGSDLHDGVGQLLTAAKLNLHALEKKLGPDLNGHQVLLDNAVSVVDETFREVRSISHNLMPNALIKRGLAQAVRDFLNKMTSDGGLLVQVEVFGFNERLDPTTESVLFRVIQELVQNIIKHAQATEITLQLVQNEQDLTIMVEDNGVGFDPAALGPDAGIGLRNIESRMAYLGGRAEFDATPGRGTTVTLEVPLRATV